MALVLLILAATGRLDPGVARAAAPEPAACPTEAADECARYRRLIEGVDSGDFVVQLASLRAASRELDPALRSLVFGKALGARDLRLRSAALRYVLASRPGFHIVLELPRQPKPAEQNTVIRLGGGMLRSLKLDETSDVLTGIIGSTRVTGAIVRGGFELGWDYCRLRMNAGEESILRGVLRCHLPNETVVELPATIELG